MTPFDRNVTNFSSTDNLNNYVNFPYPILSVSGVILVTDYDNNSNNDDNRNNNNTNNHNYNSHDNGNDIKNDIDDHIKNYGIDYINNNNGNNVKISNDNSNNKLLSYFTKDNWKRLIKLIRLKSDYVK